MEPPRRAIVWTATADEILAKVRGVEARASNDPPPSRPTQRGVNMGRRSSLGRLVPVLAAALLFLAGCAGTPNANPTASASSSAQPTTASATPPDTRACTPVTPPVTGSVVASEVQYDWAVPRTIVSKPGGDFGGDLLAVCTGDHPGENPAYSRISFYFKGGPPPYDFNYAAQVLTEAKGDPIPLQGNSFLRVHFSGIPETSVAPSQNQAVGFHNLKNYGCSGPFEGSVTCGLGIQVAAGSDQVLPIRATYLVRDPDGNGNALQYVIAFDVQAG